MKILYASEEAAKQTTVTGWVSRHGKFYGENEHLARWDGCTHRICGCGNEMERAYTACQQCRSKKHREQYEAMPFKEWDGVAMLVLYGDDTYFQEEC